MNKKFYTLVSALLLTTSFGAFAQTETVSVGTQTVTISEAYANQGDKGYETGKAYLLKATDGYLSVALNGDKWEVILTNDAPANLSELYKQMWTVTVIENEGAEPLYTFVNKYTQTTLAIDGEIAKANAAKLKADPTTTDLNFEMAGSITALQSAPSYKQPNTLEPIYANVGDDKVVYLSYQQVTSGTFKICQTITTKSDFLTSSTLKKVAIKPYKVGAITLSANDLNTLLYAGLPSTEAKADSYFDLSFDPALSSVFTDSKLQAVKVEHKELIYGKTSTDENAYSNGIYASWAEVKDAYKNTDADYVALKNVKGDYIVVDTAYVAGTDNNNNGLLKFTTDKLYNAKNETRLRHPQSYLFKFTLNITDQNVDIQTRAFIRKSKTPYDPATSTATNIISDPSTFYGKGNEAGAYSQKFVQAGSQWYNNDPFDPSTTENANKGGVVYETMTSTDVAKTRFVTHVLLGSTDYVTLGELKNETVATASNIIDIKVGAQNIFKPTTVKEGAYLLQDVKTGKYLVDNLVGGAELVEQAPRQNFQHMPAAQWIVESNGNATTVKNREFENLYKNGILYEGIGGAFFYGDNTYKFIPVEDVKDKHLGYKFMDGDDLKEARFTFNYLHDLAMDKPINTINSKDSVVWVDKDDEAMSFSLEKVIDDEYGYNGGIDGIAKLNRRVYKIKVNDANKIVNNGRYLAYDYALKKYVVTTGTGDNFLLKENNEVEGTNCYYTFLRANIMVAGKLAAEVATPKEINGKYYFYQGTLTDVAEKGYITDGDVADYYVAHPTKVINESGVLTNGYAPAGIWLTNSSIDGVRYFNEEEGKAAGLENGVDGVSFADGKWSKTFNGVANYLAYYRLGSRNSDYASDKVSVDNNTLALVNGVLSDNNYSEVANSAFAVKPAESPLYRHIATVDTVKVYRVNATEKEFLYEDAYSKYSADKDFNFLGVEGKGDAKNAAMFLDTAYVNRGTIMPQYMFVLRPTIQEADTIWCNATEGHKHATLADSLACSHTTIIPQAVKGQYLVNLSDSAKVEDQRIAEAEGGILTNKFKYENTNYVRLGFVEATHIGDSLIIANSAFTGDMTPLKPGYATTVASKDTIDLSKNEHNNVVYSLRLINDSDDFLIESEGTKKAPEQGGWIKIQNGVPVIANGTYNEVVREAEVFNLDKTSEAPTANDEIEVASDVKVIASNGAVIIKNAAGKKVVITNILGKALATETVASNNETIAVPAGIVVVSVEGEEAAKVVVR